MSKATLLIVDDEEELRENLRDLLEFSEYNVTAAASGEEALEKFAANAFDAVLLDIQLPGIDGLETLRRMKEIQPDIPAGMVSASSVRGVLAKAEEYGAAFTILKPYSTKEMLKAVDMLLSRERL
jgi:CheY-like chemotaxis protein